MVRQSRWLRDTRAGGRADPLDVRILFQRGRTAALRDGANARRPRLPRPLPGDLLIAAAPGDWRAALLENGVPVELYVERGDRGEVGSIHLGRVRRLVPALGAALVDIGGDRPAFLPATEVLPRGRRLDEGERLIVQVRREAQGGKPARLTTGVTLRGSHLELRVGRPGIVGGDILSPDQRVQLLAALADVALAGGIAPHPPASRVLPSPRKRGEGWGEGQ